MVGMTIYFITIGSPKSINSIPCSRAVGGETGPIRWCQTRRPNWQHKEFIPRMTLFWRILPLYAGYTVVCTLNRKAQNLLGNIYQSGYLYK